jgi:uncharacterized repeat protein (TIGR01451 family)
MNKKLLFSLTTIALLFFSSITFSQTLDLGILETFETFAGAGAVTNSGTSSGDVGTNLGIISGTGFNPANGYTGTVYNNDATTIQARIDLLRVYIHLDDIFVTQPSTHAPAFGGGETISPGVYSIGGAGSLAGALTLDGGGDTNAVFIMKFEGAFTVGASSTVILSNGTRAANVFWIAQGAISDGGASVIKGTLFAHPGAVTLGVNSTIEGRLFTSEGAITIAAGAVAEIPVGPITIPITCLGNCTSAPAVDVLGSLKNFAFFTTLGAVANAATSGIVGDIGTHGGAISGFGTSTHVGSFYNAAIPADFAITEQAVADLDNAYNQLMLLPNTVTGHTPAFGSGETITAGVYHIAGAGSLAGTITLDGQNDPDAYFVFKFAGAFSVAAQSRVILKNGARRCNIFWISGAGVPTGAMDLGTFTYMKGTLLAHGGACSAGANSSVEGRMLSTGGAIGFSTGVVYNDTLCFVASEPVSDGDQLVCAGGDPNQTLTASASNPNATNQTMVWYDAPTGGNVVDPPTQVGIGSKTIYAESFNGAYSSLTRAAVTLTITDCSVLLAATDDSYTPEQVAATPTNVGDVTANDTLDGVAATPTNTDVTPITTEPLSIDSSGILTLAPDTPAGTYLITYQICQAESGSNMTNCKTATATVVVANASIAVVKTAVIGGTGTGLLNEVITYTFEVTNTGDITVDNIVVTDIDLGPGLIITGNPIATLLAGASSSVITGTYTITQDDIDAGVITNSALATAQDPNGDDVIDTSGTAIDNDDPTETTLTQTPSIALVKIGSVSAPVSPGDLITYTFTVENTGDTTLENVIITDPLVGLTISGNPIATLPVGASSSVITGSYTITQADIDAGNVANSATATAQDSNGIDVTDTSGTANDNDTPTVTLTPAPIIVLPDFTPTIDIDGLVFLAAGDIKEFVVNVEEIKGASSDGQVVLKIAKQLAFIISYNPSMTTHTVGVGGPVNNDDWVKAENSSFITMTLNAGPGAIIGAKTVSIIGFTIERKPSIPTQTSQHITVTIENGTGLDSVNNNNTYNTIIKAQ